MLKFSADLKVNRPVERVFDWLANAENQCKFDKSSLKMELRTPGPWRAGASSGTCVIWTDGRQKFFQRFLNWSPTVALLSAVRPARTGSAHGYLSLGGPERTCIGRER